MRRGGSRADSHPTQEGVVGVYLKVFGAFSTFGFTLVQQKPGTRVKIDRR
jgi:hypothetical protein